MPVLTRSWKLLVALAAHNDWSWCCSGWFEEVGIPVRPNCQSPLRPRFSRCLTPRFAVLQFCETSRVRNSILQTSTFAKFGLNTLFLSSGLRYRLPYSYFFQQACSNRTSGVDCTSSSPGCPRKSATFARTRILALVARVLRCHKLL